MLRINDLFWSIKGEGVWTGTPMYFVRMAHCNLTCPKCDTNFNSPVDKMPVNAIMQAIRTTPAKHVVLTGGEPLLQDLSELATELQAADLKIHMESNCTIWDDVIHKVDWLAVAPKFHIQSCEVNRETLKYAHEVKFPVTCTDDLDRLPELLQMLEEVDNDAIVWLQPWNLAWDGADYSCARDLRSYSADTHKLCIDACLSNPRLRLCVQVHKLLEVK